MDPIGSDRQAWLDLIRRVNNLQRQRLDPVHYLADRLFVDSHGMKSVNQVVGDRVEMPLLDP